MLTFAVFFLLNFLLSVYNFILKSALFYLSDFWPKLAGADEFRNMNSQKVWDLVSVTVSEVIGTALLVGVGCSSLVSELDQTEEHISHIITAMTFAGAITLVVTVSVQQSLELW